MFDEIKYLSPETTILNFTIHRLDFAHHANQGAITLDRAVLVMEFLELRSLGHFPTRGKPWRWRILGKRRGEKIGKIKKKKEIEHQLLFAVADAILFAEIHQWQRDIVSAISLIYAE
jgi:hypothetical protein